MSAGDELAGDGYAGEPGVPVAASAPVARPAAIFFDAMTRDFPLDDDGHYVAIHPVDSAVQLALFLEFGKVASAPTAGNTLREVTHVDPLRALAEVRGRVNRALARLVNRGDITIESIEREPRAFGGQNVQVDYFNERLPGRPRRTETTR